MNRRTLLTLLVTPVAALAQVATLAVVVQPAPPSKRRHRVSADPQDPAYDPMAQGFVEVYFNGRKLDGCVTADEELGTVLFYGYGFDKSRGPAYYEMRGRVNIIYTKGHPLNPHREDD